MNETMRAFVGVPLPEMLRETIGAYARGLGRRVDGIKWVEPHNLHVTLAFLGDVARSRSHAIEEALVSAVRRVPPFCLEVAGSGSFPGSRRPRVLWVGLGGAADALVSLHGALWDALEPLGFERDVKPFRAHVTIGRVRRGARVRLDHGLLERALPTTFGSFSVDEIVLFRSVLGPGGPTYHREGTASLA